MAVKPHSWGEVILSLENVSLAFGENMILRDVSARIKDVIRPGRTQGQVVGLLGPSGVGKTQLFKILAGLQSASGGSIAFNSHSSGTSVERGLVGFVQQHYPLFRHRTVLGNLMLAARRNGDTHAVASARCEEMLSRFGLADRGSYYPKQISGGQRQRVAIAQQLLCSEHFVLLDEPFSGLDPRMVREVVSLIGEVAAMNELNTIIVSSHDLDSAIIAADQIWLMGHDRDSQGNKVPGARIKHTFNLIERELAWNPDPTAPNFVQFRHEVEQLFFHDL